MKEKKRIIYMRVIGFLIAFTATVLSLMYYDWKLALIILLYMFSDNIDKSLKK